MWKEDEKESKTTFKPVFSVRFWAEYCTELEYSATQWHPSNYSSPESTPYGLGCRLNARRCTTVQVKRTHGSRCPGDGRPVAGRRSLVRGTRGPRAAARGVQYQLRFYPASILPS
eukprot:5689641-Prymnesium_polylepis.1